MKKISFLTASCCLMLVSLCIATPLNSDIDHIDHSTTESITYEEAVIVVNQHLIFFQVDLIFTIASSEKLMHNHMCLARIFRLQPTGFVVVTASKRLPPVLAFSFENSFGEPGPHNPMYAMIQADIRSRLEYFDFDGSDIEEQHNPEWETCLNQTNRDKSSTGFQQWPEVGNGWLKTNWTQNYPYNDLCPIDPVTMVRSLAGCPAVAMAQIVNFHQTTNNTHFNDDDDYYHNYAGRQYWIDDDYATYDFPSYPELNDYLDTLNSHYANNTGLTNQDMAALTFACGVACKQVFTSQVSGTFGVNQAFDAYMRFGFTEASLLDESSFNVYKRIQQNIKDTLPVHLAVVDVNWTVGHNVVIDGYNTNEYFHLNFGWGGSSNGWYLLPQEIPYNLNVIEGVVVDIGHTTTALTEYNLDRKIKLFLFPNPAVDEVNIELPYSFNPPYNIQIFNAIGYEIITIENIRSINIKLNLSNYERGIYIFQLSDQQGIIGRQKLILE